VPAQQVVWLVGRTEIHPIWLRVVSTSGLHQGAHGDFICTTISCGWALVLPAFSRHPAPLDELARFRFGCGVW